MHRGLGDAVRDAHLLPPFDERLVHTVPLVAAIAELVAHPRPLHGSLNEARRGVGVVLQELEVGPGVGEVEPAVDHRRLALPGLLDAGHGCRRDPEAVEEVVLDDVVTGGDEQVHQRSHGALHTGDLVVRQLVVVRLVPVGDHLAGGQLRLPVDEALRLNGLLPARPGRGGVAAHGLVTRRSCRGRSHRSRHHRSCVPCRCCGSCWIRSRPCSRARRDRPPRSAGWTGSRCRRASTCGCR